MGRKTGGGNPRNMVIEAPEFSDGSECDSWPHVMHEEAVSCVAIFPIAIYALDMVWLHGMFALRLCGRGFYVLQGKMIVEELNNVRCYQDRRKAVQGL